MLAWNILLKVNIAKFHFPAEKKARFSYPILVV